MKYTNILNADYKEQKEERIRTGAEDELSKLEYLSHRVFDFNTYDSDIDVLFSKLMIDTITAIHTRTTFEYQKTDYQNYLLMVNMTFLADKLEWGTSIRGAWFEEKEFKLIYLDVIVPKDEFKMFFGELIQWVQNQKE